MAQTLPSVSFIVPCYKLAHFLPECVNSILSQTYGDFEILIMDDCSPDNTPEVAASFTDPRIKHIRNEPNLGHLRNYNKGIGLAHGKYIWLISADDRLRSTRVLERYVQLMESHPRIGFVLCPCISLKDGREEGIPRTFFHGDQDLIFPGHEFLLRLFNGSGIASPSAMARKECYEKLSMFPLHLPHQGDMYLWQMWAVHWDVGYFAEPMVNYRLHETSMMSVFQKTDPWIIVADEIAVLWNSKRELEKAGFSSVMKSCELAIIQKYASCMLKDTSQEAQAFRMSSGRFEESLTLHARTPEEKRSIRARVYARMGDECYWKSSTQPAFVHYKRALEEKFMFRVWAKCLFLRTGGVGARVRTILSSFRAGSMAFRGHRLP